MAYRDYDDSPLMQFMRIVTKTFSVGTFFGVHVRMFWAAAVLMPLFFLIYSGGATFLERLVRAAIAFFGLFVVVWTHEMGHITAGWRLRIRTDLITLSPLGGVAHMNAPVSSPREELFVTLAGPATHLVWLLVFWPLQLLLPARVIDVENWWSCPLMFAVRYLVDLNTGLLLFNLLPIFPLDGGRCLRALLAMRVHANRATLWATSVGIAGGAVFAVWSLMQPTLWSTIFFVLGLSCITASLQERRLARHQLVYGERARDPWAMDPDAWKRGQGPLAELRPRPPGRFRRWLRARDERRVQRAAAQQAELDRAVDAVLDRVNQVGMTGLTDAEKAVLKRASKRRRGVG